MSEDAGAGPCTISYTLLVCAHNGRTFLSQSNALPLTIHCTPGTLRLTADASAATVCNNVPADVLTVLVLQLLAEVRQGA